MESVKIKTANYFYLLILVLLSTAGGYVQLKNIFSGLIITEFGFILLPILVYLFAKRYDVKSILKIRRIKISYILFAVIIALVGWVVSEAISVIWLFLAGRWIVVPPNPIPAPENTRIFIEEIITVAFSAAVCEELFFRGFFMTAYERAGSRRAIVMSGIFFALLHMNPASIPAIAFLGILFAYSVYRTGSVFMSMIIHFVYNFMSVSIMKLAGGIEQQATSIPLESAIAWLVLGVMAFLVLVKLLKKLDAVTKPEYKPAVGGTADFLRCSIGHWPIVLSIILIFGQIVLLRVFKF
ncbi:hypothetical protein SAMN02746089_01719 [Caldanaerobius fijiensis DSM 17918]|uniref:CAAX prenyl protease 2/Lysostaphin resistance protein A-like domain-containing protein n=1 Tax=Caldanaerobius fijiensis DSM 17918 TaxID=1121256 RepID=A0A1M5AT81_9THEO|nr:type II CAAX endopeptidase family protein [Caldanaerobius fijiensis]SHF33346.1 hypothetical protein SAMN02746089_01719 [Caldanaerobius fijiensis DSM 17918]